MDKKTLIAYAKAIYETILELGGIPSGHLYAQLMGKMTLDQYNDIIGLLKDSALVSESGHYLTANPLKKAAGV